MNLPQALRPHSGPLSNPKALDISVQAAKPA
jgi:hypothetical protein